MAKDSIISPYSSELTSMNDSRVTSLDSDAQAKDLISCKLCRGFNRFHCCRQVSSPSQDPNVLKAGPNINANCRELNSLHRSRKFSISGHRHIKELFAENSTDYHDATKTKASAKDLTTEDEAAYKCCLQRIEQNSTNKRAPELGRRVSVGSPLRPKCLKLFFDLATFPKKTIFFSGHKENLGHNVDRRSIHRR